MNLVVWTSEKETVEIESDSDPDTWTWERAWFKAEATAHAIGTNSYACIACLKVDDKEWI